MEKTGVAPRVYGNNSRPKFRGRAGYYGPQPMELDAVQRKPQHQPQRKQLPKEVMDKRRNEGLCFECGLPGHRADSHRKRKTGGWKGKQKGVSAAIRVQTDPTKLAFESVMVQSKYEKPEKRYIRTIAAMTRKAAQDASEIDLEQGTHAPENRHLCVATTTVPLDGTNSDNCTTSSSQEGDSPGQLENETSFASQFDQMMMFDHPDDCCTRKTDGLYCLCSASPSEESTQTDVWENPEQVSDKEVAEEVIRRNEPTLGEQWMVVQREEHPTSTRQWMSRADPTRPIYNEPGDVPLGGPEYGSIWEVRYEDLKRIGWAYCDNGLRYTGPRTYMQTFPEPAWEYPTDNIPDIGSYWEVQAQSSTVRIWVEVDTDKHYFETVKGRTKLPRGHVYVVTAHRGTVMEWKNVLTGEYHWETNAKELNAFGIDQFGIKVQIIGYEFRAMIDSGAMGNFISVAEVLKHGIATRVKDTAYQLVTVDGSDIDHNDGVVETETVPLVMTTPAGHTEEIVFDVVKIPHTIILGLPWMELHNPAIDWVKREMRFPNCKCKSKKSIA